MPFLLKSADATRESNELANRASCDRNAIQLKQSLRGQSLDSQVASLAPPDETVVQRRSHGAEGIQQAAAHGANGPAEALPHADRIQAAFGHHDVSHIRAHTGDDAAAASRTIGAAAYATGDHVAFDGAPDLRLAAHEAAHVVQQQRGVSLSGGVGQAGDPYERHADAVADKVVRGESAEGLLDDSSGSTSSLRSGPPTVQRSGDGTPSTGDGAMPADIVADAAPDKTVDPAPPEPGAPTPDEPRRDTEAMRRAEATAIHNKVIRSELAKAAHALSSTYALKPLFGQLKRQGDAELTSFTDGCLKYVGLGRSWLADEGGAAIEGFRTSMDDFILDQALDFALDLVPFYGPLIDLGLDAYDAVKNNQAVTAAQDQFGYAEAKLADLDEAVIRRFMSGLGNQTGHLSEISGASRMLFSDVLIGRATRNVNEGLAQIDLRAKAGRATDAGHAQSAEALRREAQGIASACRALLQALEKCVAEIQKASARAHSAGKAAYDKMLVSYIKNEGDSTGGAREWGRISPIGVRVRGVVSRTDDDALQVKLSGDEMGDVSETTRRRFESMTWADFRAHKIPTVTILSIGHKFNESVLELKQDAAGGRSVSGSELEAWGFSPAVRKDDEATLWRILEKSTVARLRTG